MIALTGANELIGVECSGRDSDAPEFAAGCAPMRTVFSRTRGAASGKADQSDKSGWPTGAPVANLTGMGMESSSIIVIAILGANLLVSLLGFRAFRETADADGRAPGALSDPDTFLFIPYQVARGLKLPGVVLSNLSHAGWMHLGFNMLALFSFAGGVLSVIGAVSFLAIYVIAGIGCNVVVYVLRKDDPAYRCLGASGSVSGIVMAAVILDPTISVAFLFVPVPIPGPVFMLGYILISIYLISRNQRTGISHEGHLGGALAGGLVTGLIAPYGFSPLLRWFAELL